MQIASLDFTINGNFSGNRKHGIVYFSESVDKDLSRDDFIKEFIKWK